MKSTNPISSLNALPIIKLGGSPIIVDVPPMFPKSAMGMSIGLGSMSIALHSEIITGPISSMVETLSRKALRTQSKSMSSRVSRHMSPLLNSMSLTLQNSKMPLLARSATITIIPHSSASVL